jgi:hypothetical protein
MASVYERYYERQPAPVKIIAVAGVGLLGYSIWRSIKRQQDEKAANQLANIVEQELVGLAAEGVHPSFQDSQYESLSQAIVQAINGCGTDFDAIKMVFSSLENAADIRKLIQIFGVRYYTPCAITDPISYGIWIFNDKAFGGSLATMLYYDLDTSEQKEINSIMSAKGIDFQL